MSNNQLRLDGVKELREALRRLPIDLRDEGGAEVLAHAKAAEDEIRDAYPDRTGDLRKGVKLEVVSVGPFGAGVVVKNTSKHASIFENGTQARHTSLGADRGSMPPGHVFVPRIVKHRRAMYDALRALLTRHGLVVTGDV